MLDKLSGYKTYITLGLAWICALYQYFVEPIPGVDPEAFALVATTVGLGLRKITNGPPAKLSELGQVALGIVKFLRKGT